MKKENLYKILPHFCQEFLVTMFDFLQYKRRHGDEYHNLKNILNTLEFSDYNYLKEYQEKELVSYLSFCKQSSPYYKEVLSGIDVNKGIEVLHEIPICDKETFRKNIKAMVSGDVDDMYKAKTGGTTGAAMQVYFYWEDVAKRFAILDNFRERFGYRFGAKTAWFSGKDILSKRDLRKGRFWKTDWMYNIRYYSTYHINAETAAQYIEDIKKYKPEFIVGFPSSVVELAKYGNSNGIDLGYKLKAIFPTAESKVQAEADEMSRFFGCGVYDQYASSEGACFITECERGKLHFEMVSGIIEVVDDHDKPAQEGRMLITAFHTRGTPLIRYDIGDRMKWSSESNCACGRKTPIVESINGRINDFVYSPYTGKCNLGNLSNCVKDVNGVVKFQVVQDSPDSILVKVVKDGKIYKSNDEDNFRKELVARLGDKMNISFEYCQDIPREKSGKYRIVKNNLDLGNLYK